MYKKKLENVKKFRKNFNTRIIKSKQSYFVEEVVELLKVHTHTVGSWLKDGLAKIDDHQPYLIWGQDLMDFLNARRANKKQICQDNQLFCCKCQKPTTSKNNHVFLKTDNNRINLVGVCNECGTCTNRTIAYKKIDFFKNIFDITAAAPKNLIECGNSSAIVTKK